jgi:succinoglycan biosynthesis transport protein ExoP
VETQVEILKSEKIGLAVVKDLKLAENPEFTGPGSGLLGRVLQFFTSSGEQSETRATRKALASLLARSSITRIGRTYVLDIGFTSLDPARAAEISNAIADAYIVDLLEAKYQATRRASRWLQDRIKELRQQASDADKAVLDYKEKNKIVVLGENSPNGARSLGEQQLVELNTQLSAARAAAEEAKARLDRINDVMKKDVPDATVTDTLHSEVINRLRNNYLDLAAKEAIWSTRYGSEHLAAVNLRTQMAELRRSIVDELGRIAQGYKSDYEIAKTRVDGLERELQKLVTSSQATNRDRIGLSDLESTAKVYHSIYDNFLQRYMEAIQQQSFPITEARVISAAAPPQGKSGPLALTVLGTAAAIGIVLSFGAALLREALDRVFRTAQQVESTLNTSCLAVLPVLVPQLVPLSLSMKDIRSMPIAANGAGSNGRMPSNYSPSMAEAGLVGAGLGGDIAKGGAPKALSGRNAPKVNVRKPDASPGRRLIFSNDSFMRQVVDEPFSPFAEGVRGIKVAMDISEATRSSKTIAITSTFPGEGKSTIASNLAELIAHAGKRVILLDGDLRNPTLTRSLAPGSKTGLLDLLNGPTALHDVLCLDEHTNLNFLPAVVGARIPHTNEILASEAFAGLIESLRELYEYIIIDFPPIAPVVDVRATGQVVDSYIYVVEWGRTPKSSVRHHLLGAPQIYERLLGVVLNKANTRVMSRYQHGSGEYYGKYGRYGYGT